MTDDPTLEPSGDPAIDAILGQREARWIDSSSSDERRSVVG